jgi:hypothetical protein
MEAVLAQLLSSSPKAPEIRCETCGRCRSPVRDFRHESTSVGRVGLNDPEGAVAVIGVDHDGVHAYGI